MDISDQKAFRFGDFLETEKRMLGFAPCLHLLVP